MRAPLSLLPFTHLATHCAAVLCACGRVWTIGLLRLPSVPSSTHAVRAFHVKHHPERRSLPSSARRCRSSTRRGDPASWRHQPSSQVARNDLPHGGPSGALSSRFRCALPRPFSRLLPHTRVRRTYPSHGSFHVKRTAMPHPMARRPSGGPCSMRTVGGLLG